MSHGAYIWRLLWNPRDQKQKESEVQILKEKYEQDMKSMREEMENKFQQILARIDTGKLVG